MIVNCVANEPRALSDHQRGRAFEYESTYPLTIGNAYGVVGMTIAERSFYFLVRDDAGLPFFAHAGLFELFVSPLPSGWRFSLEQGIRASGSSLWSTPGVAVWGYPELVDSPDHLRLLLELDSQALDLFARYIAEAELGECPDVGGHS